MVATTTRIATPNGRRYLTQLCKHWGHKFEVTHGDDRGVVPFAADRRCLLAADADGLDITVEAPDEETTTRLQGVVIEHLKRFAFREDLGDAAWTPAA